MGRLADLFDFVIQRVLPILCCTMLALMVCFIGYTVIMRTVFLDPPFWGDTLALFANVWMVFLGLVIAVRERSNIAMEALYQLIPARYGRFLRRFWSVAFASLGLLMVVGGYEAASRIRGSYWELGSLPKSYPMMIIPIAGAGIIIAAMLAIFRPHKTVTETEDNEFP